MRETPLTRSFNSFSTVALTGGLKADKDSKHPETAEEQLYGTMVCEVKISNFYKVNEGLGEKSCKGG